MGNKHLDFDLARSQFLSEIGKDSPELRQHQNFMNYWRAVDREARESQDLDRIDNWLSHVDRDRVQIDAYRQRIPMMALNELERGQLLTNIEQALATVNQVKDSLSSIRRHRRSVIASLVFKAGLGVKLNREDEEAVKPPQVNPNARGGHDDLRVQEELLHKTPKAPKKGAKKGKEQERENDDKLIQ